MAKEIFYNSLFTDGICTYNCVCLSANGNTVVGYDEAIEKIILIDLNDQLTRRAYEVPIFEKITEKCFWLTMVSLERVPHTMYVALIYTKEKNKYFAISLSVDEQNEQKPVKLLHELDIDADMGEFQVGSLASIVQDENGLVYIVQDMWEEKTTSVSLLKLYVDDCGCITYDTLFERYMIKGHWHCSCVFSGAMRFITFNEYWTSINMLILPLAGEDRQPRISYIQCESEFEFASSMRADFALLYQDHLFYVLTSSDERRTTIISLDVNAKKFEFCFELSKHAVDSIAFRISQNGKLAVNGQCMDPSCEKYHLFHFSIDHSLLPPLDGRDRFFLSMNQLSVVFSNAIVDIIHGEKTLENSILLMLMLCQEVENKSSADIILYVNSEERKVFYSSYLEKVPIVAENVKIVIIDPESLIFPETTVVFLDHFCELRYDDRIMLNKRNCKTVIIIDKEIESGCDQPREKYFKWHRMPSICPRQISDYEGSERKEQYKNRSINAAFDTKKVHQGLIHLLDRFHPEWKTVFQAKQASPTICIPPCADVENTYRNKQGLEGREAERLVTDAILELNLGGILITGMNSSEFLKRLKAMSTEFVTENIAKNQKDLLKVWKEKAFEIDALFIHAHYGIVIFECKKRDLNPSAAIKDDDTFKKAVKQLEKVRNGIEILYKAVTEKSLENGLIHCIAVYPNSFIPDKVAIANPDDLQLWDRDDVMTAGHLRDRIRQFYSEAEVEPDLRPLAISLASYRSNAFISLTYNALEIYKIMDRQAYLKGTGNDNKKRVEAEAKKENLLKKQSTKKKIEKLEEDVKNKKIEKKISPAQSDNRNPHKNSEKVVKKERIEKLRLAIQSIDDPPIFLSGDQLTALESESTCLFISGPPGTGKTIVLLLKALLASNAKLTRTVFVSSRNKNHIPVLQNTISLNINRGDRTPSFYEFFGEPSDEDDYFIDEFRLDENETKSFLRKRLESKGKTIVAVTGYQSPSLIVEIDDWLKRNSLDKYEHIALSKVFRGSKKIVEEWQPYYANKLQISISHDIVGQSVSKFSCITIDETIRKLAEEMKPFVHSHSAAVVSELGEERKLHHIAILVAEKVWTFLIKSYLAANGIPSGTANEQVNNPYIVAVDWYAHCLSYEWPIVFVVAFDYFYNDDPFYVLACSRAIARLFILSRDFMATQNAIDRQIQESNANLAQMDYNQFTDVISAANQQLNERYSIEALHHNIWLAMIRHNFCPIDLQKYPVFKSCTSLAGVLNTVTGTPFICELLVEQKHFSELLTQMKDDSFRLNERLPTLLVNLWDADSDATGARKWNYLQPIRQLIEFHEISRQAEREAEYSEEQKEIQNALRSSRMWKIVAQSCYAILCSVYDQHR